MLKVIQRMVLGSLVSIVAFIAATGATPACILNLYQPEVPEELRK